VRKKRTRASHRRDGDSERWPLVSLRDNRSTAARRNRPFGAAPWHPRDPDNWRIFKKLIEVRNRERAMAEAEGREWRGLNSRQYAYRLKVARFLFTDQRRLDKKDFERVERILARARRCGLFPWGDVIDKRGIFGEPLAFANNRERIETLARWATQMSHDRMEGQKIVPELVVETEGLYDLIYDLADRYGVRHTGFKGQSGVTVRYDLAQRVRERWSRKVRTRVFGAVDYDKAGDETLEAAAADVAQHLRDMGIVPEDCLEVIRVALTPWQIRKYKIATVEKDGRLVQEAEALPTDVLRAEVEAALRKTLDMDLFERVTQEKAPEIARLSTKIRRLRP
jgi:hypothetical protein